MISISISPNGTISIGGESIKTNKRPYKGKSQIFFPDDCFIVDIESTGLSAEYDEIIEIASLKVSNGKIIDSYTSLIKPKEEISGFITNLTGISNEMVESSPSIEEVLPNFLSFLGNGIIVGHNVNFDINFLYDIKCSILNLPLTNNFVDTLRISRKVYPELPHHRLKDMVKHLNIKTDTFHRALADCHATLEIYNTLRREVLKQYESIEAFEKIFNNQNKYKLKANDITATTTNFDTDHPLYNKVCVFTGVLEKMPRKDAMQIVTNLGGICADRVTAKTNYLILGNNDYCSSIKDGKSSKQKKAEELHLKGKDIEILPEDIFYDLVQQ